MSKHESSENPAYHGSIWGVLPMDFPTNNAESVYRRLIDEIGGDSRTRHLMGFAFKGVAYRFKAMVHHGQNYEKSIIINGLTPPVEVEFEQEQSLFSFFISGMSALDCFFFALHTLAAHYAPDRFKLESEKLRNVRPESVTKSFEAEWPDAPISLATRALIDSYEFKLLARVRNMVTHRAVPPRVIRIQPGHSTEAIWQIEKTGIEDANQVLDENTISSWRAWISSQLHILWSAMEFFPPKPCHPKDSLS